MEEIKKRGRKKKVKEDETPVEEKVVKKRGRKPSNKQTVVVDENTNYNTFDEVLAVNLNLSKKILNDIYGSDDEKEKSVIIKDKINPIDDDLIEDVSDSYRKIAKENKELKNKIKELENKINKYKYLDEVAVDNGTIEKKIHMTNLNLISSDNNTWVSQTNRCCDHCCHTFTTIPIGLPESYCSIKKEFRTIGCFCSFNCAKTYNTGIKDSRIWERLSYLNRIKKIIFKEQNKAFKEINKAPPREVLIKFGGDMTIEEFRSKVITIPKKYRELMPPMIPIFGVVEEIPKYNINNNAPMTFGNNNFKTNFLL